jgi:flavorubredoxin
MKIGIIIHSHTGNTNLVAEKLREKLLENGHEVALERLRIVGGWRQGIKDIQFESLPDTGQYDTLVLGSPVEAFSLSPVMKSYLTHIALLQGKKTACLVTQHFPYPWLGGNRAVRTMEKACRSKGAVICGTAIINWSSRRRGQQITDSVDRLTGAIVS